MRRACVGAWRFRLERPCSRTIPASRATGASAAPISPASFRKRLPASSSARMCGLTEASFSRTSGVEGFISRDNPTYSRSLVADYTPYYESGARWRRPHEQPDAPVHCVCGARLRHATARQRFPERELVRWHAYRALSGDAEGCRRGTRRALRGQRPGDRHNRPTRRLSRHRGINRVGRHAAVPRALVHGAARVSRRKGRLPETFSRSVEAQCVRCDFARANVLDAGTHRRAHAYGDAVIEDRGE